MSQSRQKEDNSSRFIVSTNPKTAFVIVLSCEAYSVRRSRVIGDFGGYSYNYRRLFAYIFSCVWKGKSWPMADSVEERGAV